MKREPFKWWWLCECGHFQEEEPRCHVVPWNERHKFNRSSYRDPCPNCGKWEDNWECVSARTQNGKLERKGTMDEAELKQHMEKIVENMESTKKSMESVMRRTNISICIWGVAIVMWLASLICWISVLMRVLRLEERI